MKNKLAQLQILVSKIDRRYLQLVYTAFVLVSFLYVNAPADGGGGPF